MFVRLLRKIGIFFIVGINICIFIFFIVFYIDNPSANNVFKKMSRCVVELKCIDENVETYGTAEFVSEKGLLLTNAHLVIFKNLGEDKVFSEYYIRFFNEEDYHKVLLYKYDLKKDIALLKIIGNVSFDVVKFGDSNKISYGDKVFAIGNNSNMGLSITQGYVSLPIVVIEYNNEKYHVIQCDLNIAAGNSGGVLLDKRGYCIGMTTFRIRDSESNIVYGYAYSITSNEIVQYISESNT